MEHVMLTTPYDLSKYIPLVKIPDGNFKYVQIKAYFTTSKKKVRFIRGSKLCQLHSEIFDDFLEEFRRDAILSSMLIKGKKTDIMSLSKAITFKCKGGGRIDHEPQKQRILVYGTSEHFGRCKHKETVKILRKEYPNYKDSNITWKNDDGDEG